MSAAKRSKHPFEYDLVVIGGGSGGLAASKEATKCDPEAKVLVFDYVQPSVQGTKWGLGGTCVNVGCVPKKLMHYASLLGHAVQVDAPEYGWQGALKHDWPTMVTTINNYIKSLNFSYKAGLRSAKVQYIEGYASFKDPHTLTWKGTTKSGQVTADKFLLATGGRPNMGNFPGKEVCLNSDDIFWMKKAPGKTLVIGAGYIALECAGFLHHLGYNVTMMVRGQFMRKFDVQCGQQLGELMERSGVRFLIPASPVSFKKVQRPAPPAGSTPLPDGKVQLPDQGDAFVRVLYPSGAVEQRPKAGGRSIWQIPPGPVEVEFVQNYPSGASTPVQREVFDSVFIATGRTACVDDLCLGKVGVELRNGKIMVDHEQRTSVPHVYAVGDVCTGQLHEFPELTPVAIQVGQLIARRLFANSKEPPFRYELVASTVFAPHEYGFVGVSEEQAEKDEKEGGIGAKNVEVFWSRFGHLEISPTHAHVPPLRSRAFVGRQSWARKYCDQHNLLWPELGLDEGNQVLVLNEKGEAQEGKIVARYQEGGKGRWLFDVQLGSNEDVPMDDAAAAAVAARPVVKGVPMSQIELTPANEKENAELFIKASDLAKLIVDKRSNKVIGIHFIGPNAGEVLQGMSMALSLGATKADFDKLTGIHPTAAEEFCVLHTTKASGVSPLKKAGCGGGSCG